MTYPVPEEMLDIIRNYLKPRGIEPKRRKPLTCRIFSKPCEP